MSREGNRPLLWMIALCLLSLVGSYGAYVWWRPAQQMNPRRIDGNPALADDSIARGFGPAVSV